MDFESFVRSFSEDCGPGVCFRLSRVHAAETDFILHNPIEWWNVNVTRARFRIPAPETRPEVTFHLLQLKNSGLGAVDHVASRRAGAGTVSS